jgi:hypothetical protein
MIRVRCLPVRLLYLVTLAPFDARRPWRKIFCGSLSPAPFGFKMIGGCAILVYYKFWQYSDTLNKSALFNAFKMLGELTVKRSFNLRSNSVNSSLGRST